MIGKHKQQQLYNNNVRRVDSITEDKINEIKSFLRTTSIREAGRKANVSYYTAWCVSQGKYDEGDHLQTKAQSHMVCPITGFIYGYK